MFASGPGVAACRALCTHGGRARACRLFAFAEAVKAKYLRRLPHACSLRESIRDQQFVAMHGDLAACYLARHAFEWRKGKSKQGVNYRRHANFFFRNRRTPHVIGSALRVVYMYMYFR